MKLRRRFLVATAQFHLPENALALQLLLQRTKGLIDVVIADLYLHVAFSSPFRAPGIPWYQGAGIKTQKPAAPTHRRSADRFGSTGWRQREGSNRLLKSYP